MTKKSAAATVPSKGPSAGRPEVETDDHSQLVARRRRAFGSLRGKVSLSLREALEPLDVADQRVWGGD